MDNRQIRGADAKALIDNHIFKDAIEAVKNDLAMQRSQCKDLEKAIDLILEEQCLYNLLNKIQSFIADGMLAEKDETRARKIAEQNQPRPLNRGH